MENAIPLIVLAVLILMALGWMFGSDKIVRVLGWETDEDPSWTFGNSNK